MEPFVCKLRARSCGIPIAASRGSPMRRVSNDAGMNAADVQIFSRVARANSFKGAAQYLGLTKAAVSKSVARLERELKVRAFIDFLLRELPALQTSDRWAPYPQQAVAGKVTARSGNGLGERTSIGPA